MPRGWLLDVNSSLAGDSVELWLKSEEGRVEGRSVPYRPPFFVAGPDERLEELGRTLAEDRRVASVERVELRTDLFEPPDRRHPALSVVPARHGDRRALAMRADALGGYVTFTLFDVDLTAPQLYYIEHDLYPFAPVVWSGNDVLAREAADVIEYDPPPLVLAELSVEVEGHRKGRLPSPSDPLRAVTLGGERIEGTDERSTLERLLERLEAEDPDLLVTHGGDAFDVPQLYRRAVVHGFDERRFRLGRGPTRFGLERKGRTFESYGRILHRAPTYPLVGRIHLDLGEQFVADVGLEGFVDMARLSRLSLHVVSRQSPGTAFSSMELAVALKDGVHIAWKKNYPEDEKSARLLVAADRGGFILTPPVGLAVGIDEFDFASLFPAIMVRHNLSLETLNCACCPESPHVAPGLGYRSCTLRDGIVPKTLRPILARRLEYKRRRRSTTGAERERYTDLARAWKWVLVTSFGYQGYRNARFGRIECHEAINAYARAELAQLAERAAATGWKVLHGIVDSLWMKAPPGADPEAFAREVTESRGLPLAYEGRYRWIVFLPNHGHGFGVPQRYYGYYEHGEFKVRGIEVRRGDACAFVQRVQQEALDALAPVEGAAGFLEAIPGVLELGRRRAEELLGGTVPVGDLVLARRASKALADYRVFSDGVAALRRLASEGVERAPGEEVAYVITDGATRDWRRKVVPRELLQGDEAYDGRAYAEILARSFETLFLPFGYTLERVLDRWGLGPRRTGYRKGERRSLEDGRQRTLSEGLAS